MSRCVIFLLAGALSILCCLAPPSSTLAQSDAALRPQSYFTFSLLSHSIVTSGDLNGDEIVIAGIVTYEDRAGQQQVCAFQTDVLSNNKSRGTITITGDNAIPCGTLPVSGDVIVYFEVMDDDSGLGEYSSLIAAGAGLLGDVALDAYLGGDYDSGVASALFEAVIGYALDTIAGPDQIYDVTLRFSYDTDAALVVGCTATGSWPFWDPAPVHQVTGGKIAEVEIHYPDIGWKQQTTTVQGDFTPK